jgi:hypothetical protein
VSCSPLRPCGEDEAVLAFAPPPPGQPRLRRRSGEFWSFADALVTDLERAEPDGAAPLSRVWDVRGDPAASLLVRLWAFVAEGVAAYTELTAGEGYLGTAQDWTSLRRLAALVGFRPRPRVAAQGWVRAQVDRGAAPVVPAGTRVQAPGTPARAAQTFEVAADTQLHGDWDRLVVTWPFFATPVPDGNRIRFDGDPGLRAGHRVLIVSQDLDEPLVVAAVTAREADVGTSVVSFDRDLTGALAPRSQPGRAYRILGSAGTARRLEKVVAVDAVAKSTATVAITGYSSSAAVGQTTLVLDALLAELSAGSLVAVVSWGPTQPGVDLATVVEHAPTHWEVAPGTVVRVSHVELDSAPDEKLLGSGDALTLYVLEDAGDAANLVQPLAPPDEPRVRVHPAPVEAPAQLAILDDTGAWEVFAASPVGSWEPGGELLIDLDRSPSWMIDHAPGSGNLVAVRHGRSSGGRLGSGDAGTPNQELVVPESPVAHDLDPAGEPVSTLEVRVDGIRWDEVPTLYAAGPAQVYATRLAADGGLTVEFGDGAAGARVPTGRNNVTARYRLGGGTEGEVEPGAISALLGSVRGVKKVVGAGPTSGGADQDDERRLRTLAPARARAFGRVISLEDAVDLARGYPGVSHAAAWNDGGGARLAFVRTGSAGPRRPEDAEVEALSKFLDARRDTSFPLVVVPGYVTHVLVTAAIAVDPARTPGDVAAAALAELLDRDGPLGPADRSLGGPLAPAEVYAALHAVPGVVGVASLELGGVDVETVPLQAAAPDELLVPALSSTVQPVQS